MERCCFALLLKVVRPVLDRFSNIAAPKWSTMFTLYRIGSNSVNVAEALPQRASSQFAYIVNISGDQPVTSCWLFVAFLTDWMLRILCCI